MPDCSAFLANWLAALAIQNTAYAALLEAQENYAAAVANAADAQAAYVACISPPPPLRRRAKRRKRK